MTRKKKIIFIVFAIIILFIGFFRKRIFVPTLPSARATYYGDVPKSKRLLIGFGDQISHEARFGPKKLRK